MHTTHGIHHHSSWAQTATQAQCARSVRCDMQPASTSQSTAASADVAHDLCCSCSRVYPHTLLCDRADVCCMLCHAVLCCCRPARRSRSRSRTPPRRQRRRPTQWDVLPEGGVVPQLAAVPPSQVRATLLCTHMCRCATHPAAHTLTLSYAHVCHYTACVTHVSTPSLWIRVGIVSQHLQHLRVFCMHGPPCLPVHPLLFSPFHAPPTSHVTPPCRYLVCCPQQCLHWRAWVQQA
jgi:hypothetical protein